MPEVGDIFYDNKDQVYRCIVGISDDSEQIVHLELMYVPAGGGYLTSCSMSWLRIATIDRTWRKTKYPENIAVLAKYMLACGTTTLPIQVYEKIKGTSTR